VNKSTGEKCARSYKSAAFLTFHHANAYEQDGCIVVDFCCNEDAITMSKGSLEDACNDIHVDESEYKWTYLTRLVLPLHVPDDAQPGDNLLAKYAFAGKCTAVLQEDGAIYLSEERLADIGETLDATIYTISSFIRTLSKPNTTLSKPHRTLSKPSRTFSTPNGTLSLSNWTQLEVLRIKSVLFDLKSVLFDLESVLFGVESV
jgi:hypothetical protein